jgi:hypothetical protein
MYSYKCTSMYYSIPSESVTVNVHLNDVLWNLVDFHGINNFKEIYLTVEGHLTTYLYKKVFKIKLPRAPGKYFSNKTCSLVNLNCGAICNPFQNVMKLDLNKFSSLI